jgi:hypothetical protein
LHRHHLISENVGTSVAYNNAFATPTKHPSEHRHMQCVDTQGLMPIGRVPDRDERRVELQYQA